MDLHPSRDMVASGQKAGRTRKTQAHIRIWSTESLLTLYVFGMGEFEVGVSAVAFSQLVSFILLCINHGSQIILFVLNRAEFFFVFCLEWRKLCFSSR